MAIDDHTLKHHGAGRFQSTQWSLIMTAQQRSTRQGRQAFEKLCETYWLPLYAYARQRESEPDARDLIQGFFLKVMEKNYLLDADPKRGRFRTFMLASLGHYINNERRKTTSKKRGGDKLHLSLDFQHGEQMHALEPSDDQTPEKRFDRLWAMTLLREVLDQLRREYLAMDKVRMFEELQQFLTPVAETENYHDLGEGLGMSEGAVRVAVHRLRSRYREMLRLEIAATLGNPDEVDDEIRKLFDTFSH